MDEIGLFPLGIVLLPTERVPLHIFEPRYRELIGECLAEDREFGLVYADDDGIQAVGTRAGVTEVIDRLPDGRLNIVAEGRERFRLVEVTTGRNFHTGRVEALVDIPDTAGTAVVSRALELFRRVLEVTGSEVPEPDPQHPQLSFALAGCFELAPAVKQDLLRRTSERERLELVCEILARAGAEAERRQEIAGLAQGNGRVHPPGS
jgi:ATP-dependent Lon protease